MRAVLVIPTLVILLAGCGGQSDTAKLVKACMQDGEATRAQCDCFATQAEETLSPELLSKLADAIEDDEASNSEIMADIGMEDAGALMGFVLSVGTTCNMDMS